MTPEPVTTDTPFNSAWRAAIIALLIALLGALSLHWAYALLSTDRAMEIYDLNKEAARLASTLYFQKMTAIAQVTIALIASAWALLTLADVRIRIEGAASRFCFVLANLSFVLSLLAYAFGYDFIVARIFHHAAFDIDAEYIFHIQISQQLLFISGLLDLVFAVAFGRRVEP